MTDEFDRLIWAYRAVFTQTNAGGGNVIVTIACNERTLFLYGTIGTDNYAVDRDVTVWIEDSAGNRIGNLMFTTPTDNVRLPIIFDSVAAVADNATMKLHQRLLQGTDERIKIQASALAQNETLTLAIRALISDWPPTITTTGSGGTVTTTVTYDKVI